MSSLKAISHLTGIRGRRGCQVLQLVARMAARENPGNPADIPRYRFATFVARAVVILDQASVAERGPHAL